MRKKKKSWYMYVVRCSDSSLYAGVTTDVRRRVHEHNSTKKAARYTRARRPVYLAYHHKCFDRSEAIVSEIGFKRLSKKRKEQFILERIGDSNGVQVTSTNGHIRARSKDKESPNLDGE